MKNLLAQATRLNPNAESFHPPTALTRTKPSLRMPISITHSGAQSTSDRSNESVDHSEIRPNSPISRQNVQSRSPPIALSYPSLRSPPQQTPPSAFHDIREDEVTVTETVSVHYPNIDHFESNDRYHDDINALNHNDNYNGRESMIHPIPLRQPEGVEGEVNVVALEQELMIEGEVEVEVDEEEEEEEESEDGMEYVDYPDDLDAANLNISDISPDEDAWIHEENGYRLISPICETLQGSLAKAEVIKQCDGVALGSYVAIKRTHKTLFEQKMVFEDEDGMNEFVEEDIVKEAMILNHLTVNNQAAGNHIV